MMALKNRTESEFHVYPGPEASLVGNLQKQGHSNLPPARDPTPVGAGEVGAERGFPTAPGLGDRHGNSRT